MRISELSPPFLSELKDSLRKRKGVIVDVHGTFVDARELRFVLPDGKTVIGQLRSVTDGQGLSFMREIGLKIVLASGHGQPLDSLIEKLNDLPSVKNGKWAPVTGFTGQLAAGTKVRSIEKWLEANEMQWYDCICIGDDLNIVDVGRKCAYFFVPSDAQRVAKRFASIELTKPGGNGAVRELAELILDARGIDESTLPPA